MALPILWSSHTPSMDAVLVLHRFSPHKSVLNNLFLQELKRTVCSILSRVSEGQIGSFTSCSLLVSAFLFSSCSAFSPTHGCTQLRSTSERIRTAMSVTSPMNTPSIGSSMRIQLKRIPHCSSGFCDAFQPDRCLFGRHLCLQICKVQVRQC